MNSHDLLLLEGLEGLDTLRIDHSPTRRWVLRSRKNPFVKVPYDCALWYVKQPRYFSCREPFLPFRPHLHTNHGTSPPVKLPTASQTDQFGFPPQCYHL